MQNDAMSDSAPVAITENTLNKFLRYGIIAGIFLLTFIPLIVTKPLFFPFIVGKNFAFRIIVEIIFAGWLVLAWRDIKYRPKFSWMFAALAFFVAVVAVADIFGQDFLRSFWSNYERMDGLITLLHLFAFFVVAGSVINVKLLWIRFLQTSLAVSVLVSAYGVLQIVGAVVINQGGVRVDATFGNATYLAGYLLFSIFFAAFLAVQKNAPNWLRAIYGTAIALHIYILFNTMTRGAALALLGGSTLTVFLIILFGRNLRVLKKVAAGALLAIILLLGIFIAIKDTKFVRENDVLDRLASISLDAGKSRFLLWGAAWESIKEHPILGWGQDNFVVAFSGHYDSRMYAEEPWFDRAHNIILDWLFAAGALGLLSYALVFFAFLYAFWFYPRRRTRSGEQGVSSSEPLSVLEISVLMGLLAAYFIHNLFVFDNVVSYILFFVILSFAHYVSVEEPPAILRRLKIHIRSKDFIDRVIGPIVIVALVASLYALNVKSIIGNRMLLLGMHFSPAQEATTTDDRDAFLRGNLESFQKSLESGYLGRTEAREQLVMVARELAGAPIPQTLKQEFFTLAFDEMEKQVKETPDNLRPRLFQVNLLESYGLRDEAILVLEEAFKISDNRQDMYYLLANSYANLGNTEKALEALKKAFELNEGNARARKIYAGLLIRYGREQEAKELLSVFKEEMYRFDPIIMSAYVAIGKYDTYIAFLERQITREPENIQVYLSLSATYLETGSRGKAIETIERAIQVSPQFKERGEFFIREIKAGRNP